MAKKVRTRKTPEQRREEAAALQASIAEQVEQFRDSDQWRKFLQFAQAFHAYSLNNVMLIMAQQPAATQVAGFRKWQQLGRQVRKGERAIKIFGYSTKKITEDDGNGDETERRITIFPVLSVFDISQTDPIEGADTVVTSPATALTGDDPAGIAAAVTDYITGEGWTITRETIAGSAYGYTTPHNRRIVVEQNISAAQAAKTTIHETAHALMHADLKSGEYVAHRGLCETEAESVAYIVAGICGLDTASYSVGYVASWTDGDTDMIRETAARVLSTAHTLADAITTTDDAAAA
ncbi:DUF1738 domain-containing protein (plasmid) [Tomitella fengzijianii]|uniref:DUF1738 domain-containing protein n=1 Tax=Tomitella fengzijianii TaxID=2597660 RepID=A0A516X8V3_9ACTN|nr:ArdC-like ssDNA-binding domain-containing protein [Tomitella fengzijianii]QDQ99488.1 DUF1738 domain-containing protein [Tomitella fengzijianii]